MYYFLSILVLTLQLTRSIIQTKEQQKMSKQNEVLPVEFISEEAQAEFVKNEYNPEVWFQVASHMNFELVKPGKDQLFVNDCMVYYAKETGGFAIAQHPNGRPELAYTVAATRIPTFLECLQILMSRQFREQAAKLKAQYNLY